MKLVMKVFCLLYCFTAFSSWAVNRHGRLGLGISNELKVDVPAVSFKFQKSQSFALGALIGLNSSEETGKLGAGIKVYHNFLKGPQLYFYSSFLGAIVSKKIQNNTGSIDSHRSFQVNLTLGTEFSFTGLNSIGFSMETGFAFSKFEKFVVETVGGRSTFFIGAMHFYL